MRKLGVVDGTSIQDNPNYEVAFELGYLYRHVEEQLNIISAATGGAISVLELASRFGALILRSKSREELGPAENLPALRNEATKGNQRVAKVAMDDKSHSGGTRPLKKKRILSAAGRARISKTQKDRWAKLKRAGRAKAKLIAKGKKPSYVIKKKPRPSSWHSMSREKQREIIAKRLATRLSHQVDSSKEPQNTSEQSLVA